MTSRAVAALRLPSPAAVSARALVQSAPAAARLPRAERYAKAVASPLRCARAAVSATASKTLRPLMTERAMASPAARCAAAARSMSTVTASAPVRPKMSQTERFAPARALMPEAQGFVPAPTTQEAA